MNEDIIVDLPPSENEYLLSLGRNARAQLPYYLRRVEKEWGEAFRTMTATGADISLRMFQELVELNRVRIEHKGATHLWNAQLIEQRWKLAQECGFLWDYNTRANWWRAPCPICIRMKLSSFSSAMRSNTIDYASGNSLFG